MIPGSYAEEPLPGILDVSVLQAVNERFNVRVTVVYTIEATTPILGESETGKLRYAPRPVP